MTTAAPDIVDAFNHHHVGPIGAYPPRQCFFRAYLDSHPAYARMPRDRADVASERRSEAGLVFEMAIFDRIRARAAAGEFALADLTGVSDVPGDWPSHRGGQATWATRQAMRAGAEIIIGGVIRAEDSRHVSALPAGKRRDSSISREGSVELRRALIDLGLGLWLNDPAAKQRATELRARGKEGGVIACAMAHRANRIAFALVRDQTNYDPKEWITQD